jgi:hypothetical protein
MKMVAWCWFGWAGVVGSVFENSARTEFSINTVEGSKSEGLFSPSTEMSGEGCDGKRLRRWYPVSAINTRENKNNMTSIAFFNRLWGWFGVKTFFRKSSSMLTFTDVPWGSCGFSSEDEFIKGDLS